SARGDHVGERSLAESSGASARDPALMRMLHAPHTIGGCARARRRYLPRVPQVHVSRRSVWPDVCVRCGGGGAKRFVEIGVRSALPIPFAIDTFSVPGCRGCSRTLAWQRVALRSAVVLLGLVVVALVMLRFRFLL